MRLKNNKKGFTLIETLVAIVILGLGILGPMTIASRSLNAALLAKNQITAYFLAQDGIELIKNMRDNNRLNQTGGSRFWLYADSAITDMSSAVSGCGSPRACRVNAHTGAIVATCPSLATCNSTKIRYDSTAGVYSYTAGSNTIFSRSIVVDAISASTKEVRISSVVTWNVGSETKTITLRDNMIDIY
jgi:prepilin-type N-terminal cleavage/methylation domain-containing protein